MSTLSKNKHQLSHDTFYMHTRGRSGTQRIQCADTIGECYSDIFTPASGLTLIHSHYCPLCDLIIDEPSNPHKNHVLVITLGLQGESYYQDTGSSLLPIKFNAGYTTINSFCQSKGQRCYKAGETVSQLRLIIENQLLHQYIGEEHTNSLLGNGKLSHLSYHKTPHTSLSHASILIRHINDSTEGANRLALHSHCLCLLSEQLKLLLPQPKESLLKLAPKEMQKIEQAQNIIQQKMEEPITEDFLCEAIGISKCKLREGFRDLFNSTPHKMLLETRMRKAYLLLESGYQVAQTAWNVGYGHPNNFSVAFNKFYGYPPKFVSRKQKTMP